jgi:hypothetical protein
VLLGVALITAGIGWFRQSLWGWKLAVVTMAVQIVGDVVNSSEATCRAVERV